MAETKRNSSRRSSKPKRTVPENLDVVAEGATLVNAADLQKQSSTMLAKIFNLRLDMETHEKLKWLGDHRPESMHDIAVRGVQTEIDRIYEATKKMHELYQETL